MSPVTWSLWPVVAAAGGCTSSTCSRLWVNHLTLVLCVPLPPPPASCSRMNSRSMASHSSSARPLSSPGMVRSTATRHCAACSGLLDAARSPAPYIE